jgi:aspartate/methionine/tyrosine aminotransferase
MPLAGQLPNQKKLVNNQTKTIQPFIMVIDTADRISIIQEYYFSRKLREIDQMRKDGIDVINLGIGSPDLAPSPKTINRLHEESSKPDNHGYQSYKGIPELRNAFCRWYLRKFRVNLHPDNEVLPLMGSKEGIAHISLAFVNPGDEVLIPNPGYPTYESATRLAGGTPRQYDLTAENDWYPDLVKLKREGLSKVKIMWVNYPHMPTGTRGSEELFGRLIDFGKENNILICNDNPYSFILNEEPLSLLSARGSRDVAIELNSLSKSHNMAGWRVGMVAGHSDYINAILKVKSNMDSGMFRPLQLAAVEALDNPCSWYSQLNQLYHSRQALAFQIMDTLNCTYDENQTGMFVWAKIPDSYHCASEISDKLLQYAHVFMTPGMIFGTNGRKYLRISLCSDKALFTEANNRIIASMS